MPAIFIPVSQAKRDNLIAPNPPKEPKGQTRSEKYTRTYFQYNYGTPERPVLAQPNFELTDKVIVTVKRKVNGDGRVTWKTNFRVSNKEDLHGLNELDVGIRQTVFKYKAPFKQYSFTVENYGDLRGCCFHPRTDAGDLVEGADPIMSLKVSDDSFFKKLIPQYGHDGKIMSDANGLPMYKEESVDYKTLEDMSFECGMVFCLRDLYHNSGMPLPQLFVGTCWILSEPSQKGAVDFNQSNVIQKFLQSTTPDQLNTLADKIAEHKAAQNNSILENAAQIPTIAPPSASQTNVNPLPAPSQSTGITNGNQTMAASTSSPQVPAVQNNPSTTIDLTAYTQPKTPGQFPSMYQGQPGMILNQM